MTSESLQAPRSLRRLTLGFWVSLGLNIFLATLVGAHLLHRPPPRLGAGFLSERLIRELPADDAARVTAAMTRERPRFRASRERLNESRESLARAIAHAPYDPALVGQRLAEFRQRWQEMSDRFSEVLLPVLEELSPEGRAKLASAADRPHGRRRGGPP